MLHSIINLGLLILCALALIGYGAALSRLLRLKLWSLAALIAYGLAIGLGAASLALFGLGLLGWLTPTAGWALLIGGLALVPFRRALFGDAWAALRSRLAGWRMAGLAYWALGGLLIVQAGLNLIGDLAPPLEGDTMVSYLLVPREWVRAGAYVQPTHIWASTLPGNVMMLSTWGLLLGDESLAALLSGCLMSLALWLAVYALARVRLGARAGFLAATIIYLMPDAIYLAQSAKVDLGWAFFEALALAALWRWSDGDATGGWLALAGACSGLALGSKNQALLSLPFLLGWIVVVGVRRRDWRVLPGNLALFGVTAAVVGAPYYVYNALAYHNPTYPVFADFFARWLGGTPAPRSELGTEIFYAWTPWGYLLNLWDASLGHPAPFYLGWWAGPVYLIVLPLGLILGRCERRTKGLLWYAFLFSIAWFLTKQAVRHFLPGLVALAVAAGATLRRLDDEPDWLRGVIYGAVGLAMAVGMAFGAGIMLSNGAYRVAFGLQSPEEYVLAWADEHAGPRWADADMMRYINANLSPDERVLTVSALMPLYVEPQIVPRRWGDRFPIDSLESDEALLGYMHAHGIDCLLIFRHDLEGPDGDLPLFSRPAFLEAHAELVYASERALLYRLRE
jgi:4-amino-4-deoxy-L-arabinose transferase-like glycosyltransferase